MKKIYILGAFLFLTILSCTNRGNYKNEEKSNNDNLRPIEHFFTDRFSPKNASEWSAYRNAIDKSESSLNLRNGPEGFNGSWEVQGPGNLGGRVNTVDYNREDQNEIYIGFSLGGVWKTTNGGEDWLPIFDDISVSSIGDIVISPHSSNTVYVGTGDPNISGHPFIGNGLYRSSNGGQNWKNIGLGNTGIISKVAIHPRDSNTLYVATMGVPFYKNSDKGLYKTIDGGQSWEQVLFLSDSAGVSDVVINQNNPEIILATGWNRIRSNTKSIIEGPESQIYRSEDGGDTWETVQNGLPNTINGRIGLEYDEANPDTYYAVFVGRNDSCGNNALKGIYKSRDAGKTWNQIPTDYIPGGFPCNVYRNFGWYFGQIRVNPWNENEIYILGIETWRTTNGGLQWERITPRWWTYEVHADHHDMIFLSRDEVLIGTDGGLYKGNIQQGFWEDLEDIPTNQFYRVAYNPHFPDQYYGGMQDNGTTGGNKSFLDSWPRIFGGDGFQPGFNQDDENIQFATTQRGALYASYDGGQSFDRINNPILGGSANWDMPWVLSSHDPSVVYYGSNTVVKGIDLGGFFDWIEISPPLAGSGPFPARENNVYGLDESTLSDQILIAGTTDGSVFITTDQGGNWEDVTNNLPANRVSSVKLSPSNENVAFVTFSGYRDNDNRPKIFRSMDLGKNWTNISSNLPLLAINDVYIVPGHLDSVLFVGTDNGVYGTIDSARTWHKLGKGMPVIPVMDLQYNVEFNEVIAGTFGRSIMTYSLDTLLGGIQVSNNESTLSQELVLHPNPASNRLIVNYPQGKGSEATWKIYNLHGELVRKGISTSQKTTVEIEDLSPGQYFLKMVNKNQQLTQAFIKH